MIGIIALCLGLSATVLGFAGLATTIAHSHAEYPIERRLLKRELRIAKYFYFLCLLGSLICTIIHYLIS